MASQHEIFDLLVGDEGDWEITEPILFYAIRDSDNERLAWLLDKAGNVSITARIVAAVGEGQSGGGMAFLLEKYPDLTITEEMLKTAVASANLDAFRLLLARASDDILAQPLFHQAVFNNQLEKIVLLLDRFGDYCLTPALLRIAAWASPGMMTVLLERGGAAHITKDVMACVARFTDCKTLELALGHGGKITQELLIAVASGVNPDVLRLLLRHGCEVDGQILRLVAEDRWGSENLAIVLNHVDEAVVAQEMTSLIFQVASTMDDGPRMMRQLLDRVRNVKISEDSLFAAARNRYGGSEVMQMFLEQERTPQITAELLICAMGHLQMDVMVQLLERVETKGIIHELLEAAAANAHSGGDLVRLLLKRTFLTEIPEVVFNNAIENMDNGKEVIWALEEVFGRIKMTEDIMLKVIRQASDRLELSSGVAEYLFDPALITENVLISVMSIERSLYARVPDNEDNIQYFVAENSLHLPITIDVLKVAARRSDLNCFRFLWNRGRIANVPEDLMKEAAKNSCDGYRIVDFLLDQAEDVEIGEATMLAVVGNRGSSIKLLNLLLERGIRLQVTHGVLKTAIANIYVNEDDGRLLPLLLQRFCKGEVTEDLFKSAATAGNEDFLYKLSEFCDLKSPPGKWLDIARLYKAVAFDDTDTMRDLLNRGVKPEVAQLECSLLMERVYRGNHVLAAQMLLSAGVAPDDLVDGTTPLWIAAQWGNFEVAEVLVNAGASFDFKDNKGYTPSMIAKKEGHIKMFRFLEQSRKDRESEREALAAAST